MFDKQYRSYSNKTFNRPGFKINIDDIKYCAENENIVLVEHLSKKYNSI